MKFLALLLLFGCTEAKEPDYWTVPEDGTYTNISPEDFERLYLERPRAVLVKSSKGYVLCRSEDECKMIDALRKEEADQ